MNNSQEGQIFEQPKPNLDLEIGEGRGNFIFSMTAKKTIKNRFKYWLFCKFFPFKITRWDK